MQVEKMLTIVADPNTNPVEIIFGKIKTMFRTINEQNRSLDVETKIEMAIQTLTFEDFENAIRHVDEYIKETY
jgi:hypothetical protein